MESLTKIGLAKPLVRQIAEMPLNTAKLLCTLLARRKAGEVETRLSINQLVSLASGTKGGNTMKAFLPVAKSLSTSTFVTVDVKVKDVLDYSSEGGDLERTVRVSGTLLPTSLYDPKSKEITIKFNPDFLPILDRTKSNWVLFDPAIAAKLRSDYALKLYCWILVHLGGYDRFEFDWHFYSSGEKEESVTDYFGLEDKKGYRYASDIKLKIFERYLPDVQKLLSDTIEIRWDYIQKKRVTQKNREHTSYTESIHIVIAQKNEKKERPNTDVGEGKSPNSRPVRPALKQQKYNKENSEHKSKKNDQPTEVPVTNEIKTITDFYNESIQAKAGSDQEYSYSTISRYASPLLQSGWSVDRICSLIEANRAYYTAVKHPEHIKKPHLVFNAQEERLDKIRPFLKPMTEILVEKYCQGGLQNGAICHIPTSKFWLLDYETQAKWLDTTPYESMPEDIQAEFDRRYPDWKEIMTLCTGMPWTSSPDAPYR